MPTTTTRRAFTRAALADAADLNVSLGTFVDQVDAQMGSVTQGVLASRPTTGKDGDIYIARDDRSAGPWGTPYWWDSANSAWRPLASGEFVGDLKYSMQAANHGAQGSSIAAWLLCDGSSQLIATYPDLSALIRPTLGGADGTHFYLPDYRGRTLVGLGTHADVNALTDNDGLAVASRTPNHSHYVPWPFAENGGGGNWVGYFSSVANAWLTAMGYSLRMRLADGTGRRAGVIGKLNNGASAAANAGAMGTYDNQYTDVGTVYDVASTVVTPAYGVANIFIKT
jgi:hypothetical protein